MRGYINITAKIIGALLGLLIIFWLGISLYIYYNKKDLLQNITSQLNERISGTLAIESMEPELIRGFPGISVSLINVQLRDSLWKNHRHSLLNAKKVYLAVDAFSLLSGPPAIKRISIEDAEIYVYADSTGYSNSSIFKSSNPQDTSKRNGRINNINLRNVKFTYENKLKTKYFNFAINSYTADVKRHRTGWKALVDLDMKVNNLEFNTRKGSFIKDKRVQVSNLPLQFNSEIQKLTVPQHGIEIENDNLQIGGSFFFAKNSSDFILNVTARHIAFKKAADLLTSRISTKLKTYSLKKPINVQAKIQGELKGGKQPLVQASWQVKNNTLKAAGEMIRNCSFTGSFTNQSVPTLGRTDTNSVIVFDKMRGTLYNIDFQATKITISNLTKPFIEGNFVSNFALRKLNRVSGSETFHFDNGTARLNLIYRAPLFKMGKNKPNFIFGSIRISNAAATYKPRNLKFSSISLSLNFKGQDLYLRNMQVSSGQTRLFMEASMQNFLNLYYTDPRKIVLDWRISSPQIHLDQFLAFLGRRSSAVKSAARAANPGAASSQIFKQLDKVLEEANAHVLLKVERLSYKKFTATNVTSDITLKQSGIAINRVSLRHGGGNLNIKGNIDQTGSLNKISTEARITNVDVQKLFTAFENFGQDAITDQNLRGMFSGYTRMTASMQNDGKMVPKSFYGSLRFGLRNGALVNFEPMEKIGKFTFPNRNFANITFQNLENTLYFQGSRVTIPPMKIETSVFNIFANGVYSFTTGTHIALEIPLRNPQKDALLSDSLKEARVRRGIVVNLTAVDGYDGNVKIKLGKKSAVN